MDGSRVAKPLLKLKPRWVGPGGSDGPPTGQGAAISVLGGASGLGICIITSETVQRFGLTSKSVLGSVEGIGPSVWILPATPVATRLRPAAVLRARCCHCSALDGASRL